MNSNDSSRLTTAEPAAVAEITRLIVAALVTLGVFQLDDAAWNAITLVIGGVISVALSWWTRKRATPVANPHNDAGAPLAPTAPPTSAP